MGRSTLSEVAQGRSSIHRVDFDSFIFHIAETRYLFINEVRKIQRAPFLEG